MISDSMTHSQVRPYLPRDECRFGTMLKVVHLVSNPGFIEDLEKERSEKALLRFMLPCATVPEEERTDAQGSI